MKIDVLFSFYYSLSERKANMQSFLIYVGKYNYNFIHYTAE